MAISCYPGGRFKVTVEVEPPGGMPAMPPGYTFYAEYSGPVEDIGTGDTVLKTDEPSNLTSSGTTVDLKGTVPADAPYGVYILTRFEQRYADERGSQSKVIVREDIPRVDNLIVADPPEISAVPWATIKSVG